MASSQHTNQGYLTGHLLVATPEMEHDSFEKSVIYVCSHTKEGAMGLVINQVLQNIGCRDVLKQLKMDSSIVVNDPPIHLGGPVETGKGFILHTNDYHGAQTVTLNPDISLSSDIEVLKHIVTGQGPENIILTLGYAGWVDRQLEEEIKKNFWLVVPASKDLLFTIPDSQKWQQSLATIGVHNSERIMPSGTA